MTRWSSFLPLKADDEVVPVTRSPLSGLSEFRISSATPSAKPSCSGSVERFANGRTASVTVVESAFAVGSDGVRTAPPPPSLRSSAQAPAPAMTSASAAIAGIRRERRLFTVPARPAGAAGSASFSADPPMAERRSPTNAVQRGSPLSPRQPDRSRTAAARTSLAFRRPRS